MMSFVSLIQLAAIVGFILALQGLSSIKTAQRGNLWGMGAMGLSIGSVLVMLHPSLSLIAILGILIGGGLGGVIALRVPMMALPQLMAAFHSLVGCAAVLIAASCLLSPTAFGLPPLLPLMSCLEAGLGASIGAITFTGSLIAFIKLQGLSWPVLKKIPQTPGIRYATMGLWALTLLMFVLLPNGPTFMLMTGVALALGIIMIVPIGGADMPVVVSMLNSYSGWAAAGIGLTLSNPLLIVIGALVGSSGAILSYVMCRGMNRSFLQVILATAADESQGPASDAGPAKAFKQGGAEDAAFLMKNASTVLIIPGYGMAVAQAQHALKEMVDLLKEAGVKVRFAIHPVAGRMPGHMNVLLAEAGVVHEEVLEMEEVNNDFATTDVAFVIGANDITNPSAKTDRTSPLYGMPILEVEKARTVLFIKRSMGAGYSGVDNPLFYSDHTLMLLGDAKRVCEAISKAIVAD